MGIEIALTRLHKFWTNSQIDLGANWRDASYCALDLETTGLNLKSDEIIAIGTVQIRNSRILAQENFYREVRPHNLPSKKSVEVHGIRGVDLEIAAPIEELIPELVDQLNGRVLITHATWVEKAFLEPHLPGSGMRFPRKTIDTAALARAFGYASAQSDHEPSLEFLARRMHLPAYAPHNALGDALTTAVVFLAQATELERVKLAEGESMLTLRDLFEVSARNSRK